MGVVELNGPYDDNNGPFDDSGGPYDAPRVTFPPIIIQTLNLKNSCALLLPLTLLFFSRNLFFYSYDEFICVEERFQSLVRWQFGYSVCWVVLAVDLLYLGAFLLLS